MGTQTGSVTLHPSGYEDNTNVTLSNIKRAYNSTSNTQYATISISQSSTGYLYFTFDVSDVPAGATITSVTGTVKVRVSNTTRVTNTKCQLFVSDTAKGNNVTFASTSQSNVVTLSPGNTWSRSDLNNLRLKIGGTGSSSTSSRAIYLYGANIVVNYSLATYDITISNSTSATVMASESEVASGGSVDIYTDTVSNITFTDNGTDVTSQFTQIPSGTVSAVPGSSYTTGFSNSSGAFYQNSSTTSAAWLEYAIGHSAESPYSTSDTNNTYVKPEGSTGWINYKFDFSEIPLLATINSVSVKVYGARENAAVDSTHVARFQCYSGSTAKGTLQNFTSTSNGSVTVSDVGTWTASELHDAQLRFELGYYGGRMLGITWSVTYTVSGYQYTITNVAANHTIVVAPAGGGNPTIYYKVNGSWVAATAVYKKVNGSWVLQSNLANVFDSQTNYAKGN